MVPAFSLAGRHAVVVGAASGIGSATARLLAELGAAVTLADLEAPQALAEALRAAGHAVAGCRACDISDRAAAETLIAQSSRPDILVVTAAVCPWDDWRAPDWDDAFAQVIAVNLKGALDLSRAALARMANGGGRIVFVSSLAGRTGGLIASPHYVASKGGLNAFVKWLARQGAPHGVLVNAVAPASVATPMMEGRAVDLGGIPLGRMATVEEVAGPIAFLCTPAAGYMTGTMLDVNGGVYAS